MSDRTIEELRAEAAERVKQARAERAAHIPRRLQPQILDRVEEVEARLDEQAAQSAVLAASLAAARRIADGETEDARRGLRLIQGGAAG